MQSDPNVPAFATLALSEPIQRALIEQGYTHPSPIQARAIPPLLEGRDLIGIAQTGTGKTAAFALPILHRFSTMPGKREPRRPRALILTPTRELASQIADHFCKYGRHVPMRTAVVYGGVGQHPQVRELTSGVDVLVATPSRLLDLRQQGHVSFDRVEVFVLDEADRMLDLGFAPDVRRVIAQLPPQRQSLLFSATLPDDIRDIAARLLKNPVRVEVTPGATTAERITQKLRMVDKADKPALLAHTVREHADGLVLVFSRTKHGANRIADRLGRDGIAAQAIHGNKSQAARERALADFRSGRTRVLVATDIAARGIDVKGISLVVNFDLPVEPEAYVHRIGRTARAGADGMAISFCEPGERDQRRSIERLIRQPIPLCEAHPFPSTGRGAPSEPSRGGGNRGRGGFGAAPARTDRGRSHAQRGARAPATAGAAAPAAAAGHGHAPAGRGRGSNAHRRNR